MVKIPTTEREYYNTERKINTLAAYAGALLKPAEQAQEVAQNFNSIKSDTYSSEARIKLDDMVDKWRLENQANPDNPQAKETLNNSMREILNGYKEQIDPTMRMDWDVTSNKMINAYSLSNQQWAADRKIENTKIDVAKNINNNLILASRHGTTNNLLGATADFANSYKQLLSYSTASMGEVDAKNLLKDYEKQYMESYINGLAQVSPQKAMELLETPEIARSLGDDKSQQKITSIIKRQMAMFDFNNKVKIFNTEKELTDKLDTMSTSEALQLLDENENNVSKKFYNAKQKALLSEKGISSATRADTALDLLLEIESLNKDNEIEYLNGAGEVLAKIEDKYSEGELSLNDKKTLTRRIYKEEAKQVDFLKSNEDDNKWWRIDFSYKDANDYINKNLLAKSGASKLMLDYFHKVEGQNLSQYQKKQILVDMVKKAKSEDLSVPIFKNEAEAKKAFEAGTIKKGQTIFIAGVKGTI